MGLVVRLLDGWVVGDWRVEVRSWSWKTVGVQKKVDCGLEFPKSTIVLSFFIRLRFSILLTGCQLQEAAA